MGIATIVLHALARVDLTVDEIAFIQALRRRQVSEAIQTLRRRQLAERVPDASKIATYRITEAGRSWIDSGQEVRSGQGEKPRTRTTGLRERAWWHLRAHKVVTLKDLLTTHALGHEAAPDTNLFKYLSALARAGVLARIARRVPARQSRGLVQWRLVRDLGPKAPVWRERSFAVYDPNADEILPLDRPESAAETAETAAETTGQAESTP